MNRMSGVELFAHAAAALIGDHDDVADSLAQLVADSGALLGADAAALLVSEGSNHGLRLLSATSHRAVELEMLQAQHRAGPCVDCLETDAPVVATGVEALAERWGEVGEAIAAAGFHAVLALPMHYRGVALGGLNLFYAGAAPSRETHELAQAVADMATLLVVHSSPVGEEQVRARMAEALSARELVEQAKGVLAHTEGLTMEEAYTELLRRSVALVTPLTRTALAVVEEAVGRERP